LLDFSDRCWQAIEACNFLIGLAAKGSCENFRLGNRLAIEGGKGFGGDVVDAIFFG
jgi:hypothetical protein